MSRVAALGVYRPAWQRGSVRVAGPDEDMITLAVAAGRVLLAPQDSVKRVVLVSAEPDYLDGAPLPALGRGLGLDATVPIELRIGGAPAALDAVASAAPGTLVLAVSNATDTVSAASLVGEHGMRLDDAATLTNSIPMRVRAAGQAQSSRYADSRVERELAWAPLVERLGSGHDKPVLVGIPPNEAKRFGARSFDALPGGAAASLVALATAAESLESGRLVAVDAALGTAVTISDPNAVRVTSDVRPAVDDAARPRVVGDPLAIPMSMPSYGRAFESKLTLIAMRCPECGTEAYPRRERCLGCGRMGDGEAFTLPRTGEVYSVVAVHAPVPGLWTPREIAVVSLPPTTVRVLAQVTDQPAGGCAIGDPGELVLRLIAVREGVPDYGYAFRPEVSS